MGGGIPSPPPLPLYVQGLIYVLSLHVLSVHVRVLPIRSSPYFITFRWNFNSSGILVHRV